MTIVDISKWQGDINFDMMASKINGAIMRASHGFRQDSKLEQNYSGLTNRNVPLGAYHFFRPDNSTDLQAKTFLQALQNKNFSLPLVVDVETNPTGVSPTNYDDKIKRFIALVKANRRNDEIAIYTRASFWDFHLRGVANWAAQHKLWVAHYTTSSAPLIPRIWQSAGWWLWQYTEKGDGLSFGAESRGLDLNRLNPAFSLPSQPQGTGTGATTEDTTTSIGGTFATGSQPAPTSLPRLKVLRNVNVRSTPELNAEVLTTLTAGNVVSIEKLHIVSAWQVWAKHAGGWSAVTFNGIKFMDAV